ncbi:MAG: type II toxin-antitoxin system HicB family antitoxin [Chloroflexi bacterium]|nr:type II toxin-antitoxin system HicB family antitoxin [Chloroflexota bacterium]
MTKREFYVLIEKGEDGYLIADVPELPGCHTQGETKEELLANIKEAIELYLEVQDERYLSEPSPTIVSVEKIKVGT